MHILDVCNLSRGEKCFFLYKMRSNSVFVVTVMIVSAGLSDNEQLRKDILTGEEDSKEAKELQAGRRLSFREAKKLDTENEQMPTNDTSQFD